MSWKSVTIKAYASLGQESWLNRKCRDSSRENSDRRGPQEVSNPKPCSMPDQKRLLMLIPSQALTSHLSGHPVQQSSQKESFTFQLEIFLFWSTPVVSCILRIHHYEGCFLHHLHVEHLLVPTPSHFFYRLNNSCFPCFSWQVFSSMVILSASPNLLLSVLYWGGPKGRSCIDKI